MRDLAGPDPRRAVSIVPVARVIDLDAAPVDTVDAYLRLHALSHRLVRPNDLNLDGLFGVLPEEAGPRRRGLALAGAILGRVAGVVVASLLVLEVLFRLFVPNPNMQVRGMYQEDAFGIHLRPGWEGRVHTSEFDVPIRIGEDGMREVPPTGGPSGKTLLALGDSFTFGCWSAADRTWLAGLQRALGVRVLDGGSPNAGTDSAAAWLRGPGAAAKPDLLLVAFYAGNDLYDNMVGRDAFTLDAGFLVLKPEAEGRWGRYDCLSRAPQDPRAAGRPWYRSLLRRSHFYQYVRSRLYAADRSLLRPNQPQAWFLREYTPEMEGALAATDRHLDDLLAQALRRGIPMAVVVIPSSQEVYDEEWQAWLASRGLDESLFDRGRPRRFVTEWARENGVAALDLLPALRGRERLYYRADMHWNDLGHFQAGEQVASFLRVQGLVKEETP